MESQGPEVLGRYALFDPIAAGGMATVHYGRLMGDAGFARTVAVKRLYPQFAKDPEFVSMFLDEARLAARIRHPNVVQTLDVVSLDEELILVMEYVQGESLGRVLRALSEEGTRAPLDVTSAIICSVLHGLHAAHEAKNDKGEPLNIVHRDVSPQNVLVGADGVVRIIDFGVAKAADRVHTTRDGNIKGKLSYMAPEQLHDKVLDRRADIFAAGIVLWELLTGQRLFKASSESATLMRVLEQPIDPPSRLSPDVPRSLDEITLRALARHPSKRYATAREMALALEAAVPVASTTRVATWLEGIAGDVLVARAQTLARIEESGRFAHADAAKAIAAPVSSSSGEGSDDVTASQGSSISARRPAPKKRTVRWVGYAVVALVAALGGIFASRARHAGESNAKAEPSGETATRNAAAASASGDPGPAAIASAGASASASAGVTPAGTASTRSSTSTSTSAAPAGTGKTVPRAKPRGTNSPSKKPCVPSFVDENGIKQYRNCP